MKNEKLMDAIGMMDEQFLEEALKDQPSSRKRISFGRMMRNILAAVLAVAMLGCVVWAGTIQEEPEPQWEPYADADTMLDILFGTRRSTPNEGKVEIRRKVVGKSEYGTTQYEEERIPVISSASREPVSHELSALVEPYIIPVGKSVVDPTGTITLEVMAYLYEPETHCGIVYLKLTDPTGEFGGYVWDPPILTAGEEVPDDTPKGICTYLETFYRLWGKAYAYEGHLGLRMVGDLSDETTWTIAAYFFYDNYDTVDLDIGFRTESMVDYRPYRIDIDLEKTPTMDTLVLGNAGNKEMIFVSPVGMRIDGESIAEHWNRANRVVIHFTDGSSYVVTDEGACVYGYGARINDYFAFANILDISKIQSVEVNGIKYVEVTW